MHKSMHRFLPFPVAPCRETSRAGSAEASGVEKDGPRKSAREGDLAHVGAGCPAMAMVSPAWLEHAACGLGSRQSVPVNCIHCNASVNGEWLHAPQYAPVIVPDLARIVAIWHRLPEPIRRAIRALVDASIHPESEH